MTVKDSIVKRLTQTIEKNEDEILKAKKILKDPNLSMLVSRNFGQTIDKINPRKLCIEGAAVSDLIPRPEDDPEE